MLYIKLCWNHLVFWTVPTLPETHYANLGSIYFQLGKYVKAISRFNKSEESHNNDKTFSRYNWFYLGRSYLNLGNYKNALLYLNKYLALNPRDNFVRFVVGSCHEALNESEMALREYNEALKDGFHFIRLHLALVETLKNMGLRDEAIKRLHEAEAQCNDLTEKAIVRSMSNWVSGNFEIAVSLLKDLISKVNDNAHDSVSISKAYVYMMLARIQEDAKDLSGLLATLETAQAQYPNDPAIMNKLALCYADNEKNLDKAECLIMIALKHMPQDSFFLDTKAWILHKMGKSTEAENVIKESLELNPKSKETLAHLKSIQNAVR